MGRADSGTGGGDTADEVESLLALYGLFGESKQTYTHHTEKISEKEASHSLVGETLLG